MRDVATHRVKTGLAEMLKGGVIMDVVTPDQARVAEAAGAVAVMALERVPSDIRTHGGVARMSDPSMIEGIKEAVTIPVMAKARIGHFVEAQLLESLEVDYVDESEVLTPADEANHIDKWAFKVPFVCGATNLGEALRRIGEGAAMIRTKGEAGTGNVVEAVRHMRAIHGEIRRLGGLDDAELYKSAKELAAPLDLVREIAASGKLPVVNFSAGGYRHSRRRGADDAARRRGRVRRLGDLQVRGPRPHGRGDRRGHDPFRQARARGRRLARARRGHGRPRDLLARRAERHRPAPAPRLVGPVAVVGVLALQGDFEAHVRVLGGLGAQPRVVREPADLEGLDGLVIPGGESTTMTLGIEREGLAEPLRDLVRAGTPTLGTCAGLIMLDRDHLGVLDMSARRNAFGRQVASFEEELELPLDSGSEPTRVRAVFIRAPWVEEHGGDVEVLASVGDHPVAVRAGDVLAVAFHPEISGEDRLHRWLLDRIAARAEHAPPRAEPRGPRRSTTSQEIA